MAEIALNEAQKAVVRRYVDLWRRWRPGIRGFANLEEHMERRFALLGDGIAVSNTPGTPAITADSKDDKFYRAIFLDDDDAVPDLTIAELAEARRYVIHGEGDMPTRKWRPRASSTAAVFTLQLGSMAALR